jgi:hydrogenase nickel incorporation protein HypA/HybF
MHELSIALSILDVAAEEAQRRGLGRVAAIHLRLGPLSGVVKDALLSAYGLAREGGPLESADLVIEDVPLIVYCPACAAPRTLPSPQPLGCPACGTPTPQVVSGRELEVAALEVEG